MDKQPIEIRDERGPGWYWSDNLFIDSYGELVGNYAVAVYAVLCRHASNDLRTCFPSMQTIGRKAGIKSRKTVSKAIETLELHNIIKVEKKQGIDGKRLNNIYHLMKPKEWQGYQFTVDIGFKMASDPASVPSDSIFYEISSKIIEKKSEDIDREYASIHYPWLSYEAWQEWVTYRKQKKQKLTPLSIKKQLAMLELNKGDHVEIITRSIQNGWTGLFPLVKQKSADVLRASAGKYARYDNHS